MCSNQMWKSAITYSFQNSLAMRRPHFLLGQLNLYHFPLERLIETPKPPNTNLALNSYFYILNDIFCSFFTSKQFWLLSKLLWPASLYCLPFFPPILSFSTVCPDRHRPYLPRSFLLPNSVIRKLPSLCFFSYGLSDLNALRFPQVLCSPSFPFCLKLGNFVPSVHYISASKFSLQQQARPWKWMPYV